MISNPCNWFAGGGNFSDLKSFTYRTIEKPDFSAGATKEELEEQLLKEAECPRFLWHFSPRANGLSTTMENNLVWFANDAQQAMKILRAMFEFRIQCARENAKHHSANIQAAHAEEFLERDLHIVSIYKGYLEAMDNNKLIITIAPVNQFYKVGWASNDTLQ